MNQEKKISPAVAALIVIALIGLAATAVVVADKKGAEISSIISSGGRSRGATDPIGPSTTTDTSTYADGTYSAVGSYMAPGGRESVKVTITIKDGTIASTSLDKQAVNSDSMQYQVLFDNNYKDLIVGKKMNDISSLSRVAGSSLTSNGFNDALDQIKADAKA